MATSSELDLGMPAPGQIDGREPQLARVALAVEVEPAVLGRRQHLGHGNELVRRVGTAPDLAAEDACEDGALDVEVGRLALVGHADEQASRHALVAGPSGDA